MSSKIKITDVVSKYNGDGDFAEWWRRFEAICKLQSLSVADRATLVPLMLLGPAFLVYDKIADGDRGDLVTVKKKLMSAFSISRYAAWEQLQNRKLQSGENVDSFFADLQRLSELAGIDNAASLAFVAGLPENVSQQLRMMDNPSDELLVSRARVLMEVERYADVVVVAKAKRSSVGFASASRCYSCNQIGHFSRDCEANSKKESNQGNQGNNLRSRVVTCFKCGQVGHFANGCAAVASGNAQGATSSAE